MGIKRKRGALTTILLDLWMYIAFVLIILIFYALFKLSSAEISDKQIIGPEAKAKSYTNLLNYLRTPVMVDGKEITVADLIRLWSFEPDNYRELLEKTSIEILNSIEYEYNNPSADNRVVRGFNIIINSEKKSDNSLDHLLDFKSVFFESGYALRDTHGRGVLTSEQFLPISEDKSLYIVMMESQKAK